MKIKVNGLYLSLLLVFSLVFFSGCDGSNGKGTVIEPKVQVVTLSVDKKIIKSDGVDCITFSVLADNVDVSETAMIIYENEGEKTVAESVFATNIPGTYMFYSIYESVSSDTIKVEVLSANLSLGSDVTTIKADGISNVTFSVTEYDEDITEIAEIYYIGDDETEIKLEGNVFNTTAEGVYKFFGKHKENVSDTISIEVMPLILTLVPDVLTIRANGIDVVSFTVIFDGEDISESATVYVKNGNNDYVINNNAFSTEKDGMYGFYAIYNDKKSESVTVEAIISKLVITPDKETVRAGTNISFTAISNDEDDVSSEIELVIIKDGNEEVVKGNNFTPPTFGNYSIFARYEDKVSKTIHMNIFVGNVIINVDKTELKSTNSDFAQFTVFADGIRVDDAEVFVKNAYGDQKLVENKFSTGVFDTYLFYAKFQDLKSGDVSVRVNKTPFIKRSCVMAVVSSYCGWSAEMIEICNIIHNSEISERILPVALHVPPSRLVSLDIDGDFILEMYNQIGKVPLGVMDFDRRLFRNIGDFENSHTVMHQFHPVTSGVAITSKLNSNSIDVTLRIKANEVGNYSIGVVIVEDNVMQGQTIYPGGDKDKFYIDYSFVHNGVATFIRPGTSVYPGKLLGSLGGGREVTESFSIDLNRKIVDRDVNYNNCRVVAYVMKNEGSKYFINNAATCPVNGSVGYNHE